jgi:hypothetical protein
MAAPLGVVVKSHPYRAGIALAPVRREIPKTGTSVDAVK